MVCPYCQYENRESAHFCLNCGKKITLVCEQCDTKLPVYANYCDNCGQQVSELVAPIGKLSVDEPVSVGKTSAAPVSTLSRYIPEDMAKKLDQVRVDGSMEGERRVVTMLFCDVVGSTAAAEKIDPEDWTDIINQAFEYMIRPIYTYEGTVARLMGDAVLAFFGAPLAHEDDPQRAALAALDIVVGIHPLREDVNKRFGIDFNVRVGINTGMVVVGAVGSDLWMEYTAIGDAVNVASRMEQTAEPGTIQITEDTYRLITPFFKTQELGSIRIKGKVKPLRTYRVLARKPVNGQVGKITDQRTALVGRDEELSVLLDVFSQTDHGVGRIVGVIGEAGMGKSRMIDEGLKRWKGDRHNAKYYQINSQSYETNQAYGLFKRLFRRFTGIERYDPTDVQQQKIEVFLNETDAAKHADALPVFLTLLGLELSNGIEPLEGEEFKRTLYDVTENFCLELFKNNQTILVFEDINWSDKPSIDLLYHLLPLVEKTPLVMVFSFRPDRQADSWEFKSQVEDYFHHNYNLIWINPLSRKESEVLVDHLLTIPDFPDRVRDRILERAGGNPFFIEEVVRSLKGSGFLYPQEREVDGNRKVYWRAEVGAEDIEIPESLQSMLTARIDRLGEELRRTLQLTCVIGRTFNRQVLAAIAKINQIDLLKLDDHLKKLLRLELIYEVSRQPEVVYGFKPPLIQETIYSSILKKRRREIHQQVAETLVGLYPEQINDLAAHLGYHFSEANNHKQALKYYTRAGDDAMQLYANSLAVSHYSASLAQARALDPQPVEQLQYLYQQKGRAFELESNFQEAIDNYFEELALGQELDERSLELTALVSLGTVYAIASESVDPEKGEELSKEALQLAEKLGDMEAQARILWNLLNLYRYQGRYEEGMLAGERGLKLALEIGNDEIKAYIYNDLPYVYFGLFKIKKSLDTLRQATKIWRRLGNQPMLADSLASSSFAYAYLGNYDEAIEVAEEAKTISSDINNPWGIVYSRFYVGNVYEDRGQIDLAIRDYEKIKSLGKKAGFLIGEFWGNSRLAHLYTELNSMHKAERILDAAPSIPESAPGLLSVYGSMITVEKINLLLASGDIDSAEYLIKNSNFESAKAISLASIFVHELNTRLLLAKCEYRTAIQYSDDVINKYISTENKSFLPQMLLAKGTGHIRLHQYELAASALNEARQIAEELKAHWRLWQIYLALAELEEELGHPENAGELRTKAKKSIRSICDTISQPELREAFLNRPDVSAVMLK